MGDMADAMIDEGFEQEAARGSGSWMDPEQEPEEGTVCPKVDSCPGATQACVDDALHAQMYCNLWTGG